MKLTFLIIATMFSYNSIFAQVYVNIGGVSRIGENCATAASNCGTFINFTIQNPNGSPTKAFYKIVLKTLSEADINFFDQESKFKISHQYMDSVTFSGNDPNETHSINIDILHDDIAEEDETMEVDVYKLTNSAQSRGSIFTFTILDDDRTTSIQNKNENNVFKIFPNPASNFIQLDFPTENIKSIICTNMLGQKFILSHSYGNEYNVEALNTGLYSIQITDKNNNVLTSKFTKF